MSQARTNPQILDEAVGVHHNPRPTIALPMVSLTKMQIGEKVETWLNDVLEEYDPKEVYVLLKQMEEAVSVAVEKTKTVAFESMAKQFGGQVSGQVLGHGIKLSYPKKWTYSDMVTALSIRQKAELEIAQKIEQANGTAKQETQLGRITVTLQPGKEH
jgi:hypothetical protein